MPIITTAKTINEVKRQFPYLAKPPVTVDGQPTGVMPRKVAALEFQPIGAETAPLFPSKHLCACPERVLANSCFSFCIGNSLVQFLTEPKRLSCAEAATEAVPNIPGGLPIRYAFKAAAGALTHYMILICN